MSDLKIISGRSNIPLAKEIVAQNGISLVEVDFIDFSNKEIKVKILESLRGKDVFIMQTTAPNDPHKWMMELFILIHTAKKASANKITAVIPYIYGSRQDRKTESRTPITIQLMGDLLRASGIDRVMTVSLHNPASVAAFGDIPVDNLTTSRIFIPKLLELIKDPEDFIALSPDAGGVPRAKAYANALGIDLGFTYKIRPKDNESAILGFNAEVENKNVIIIDDMIDTGGSLIKVIEATKERGAKDIYICATHGILTRNAINKLEESKIDKIFITDSISHTSLTSKFEVVSIAELLYKSIKAVHDNESVGALFEKVV